MSRSKLTKSQEKFLLKNYSLLPIEELARKLQLKPADILAAKRHLNLNTTKTLPLDSNSARILNHARFLEFSPLIIIVSMAICYAAYFSFLCFRKYWSYAYNDFDLSVHAQSLWNILHRSIDSSILGLPFLGNHADFILFLIAPLYYVFQSPLLLLFIQSFALGAGIIPIYLIGKHLDIPRGGVLIGLAYLFYPAMGYMNLYEFHPTALSTFFLLWTCWAFETKRYMSFWIWAILAILCQENLPLVIFMFGPLAWLKKKPLKWILSPMLVGGFIFFLLTSWFLPHLNQGRVGYESLYAHLGKGPFEILGTIIFRPFYVLQILFRSQNFDFLGNLFFPVAFLAFVRPLWLIPSIPLFFQHLLSSRATEQTIIYHYTAELIPFIFVSVLAGWKKITTSNRFERIVGVLSGSFILWIIISNFVIGPHFMALGELKKWTPDELDNVKNQWVKEIPADASVMCTFEFLPHLCNRSQLYSFHHFYTGRYTLSQKEYRPPDHIKYLLIDAMDHLTFGTFLNKEGDNRLRDYLKEGSWRLRKAVDNLLFFEKDSAPSSPLWQISPSQKDQPAKAVFTGGLKYLDSKITSQPVKAGETLDIHWQWAVEKPLLSDYWIKIEVRDSEGNIVLERFHPPGYHIYPVDEWKENETFEEDYHLLLPASLPQGTYTIHFIVIDRIAGRVLNVEKKSSDLIFTNNGIRLGSFKIGA